jgi:hypothetical protein
LYNIVTKTWEPFNIVGELPAGREGHAAWLVEDMMIIYGGNSVQKGLLSDFIGFDFEDKRWNEMTLTGVSPGTRE